jgi:hypothetical protein
MTDQHERVDLGEIIVGVDTHKDTHVAVAIDPLGRRLDQRTVCTDRAGLLTLLEWSRKLSTSRVWGVEGTGSYGAGLTRLLTGSGEPVHEVSRPNRRLRRERGKSDPIDAEAAARSVLAEQSPVVPKSSDHANESLRQLRATRRSAVKARTQASNLLRALLITAPGDLRADLNHVNLKDTIRICSRLRPAASSNPREACKLSLRQQPAAGSISTLRSPSPPSPPSPQQPPLSCWTGSVSDPMWRRLCSSPPGETPTGCAPSRALLPSAAFPRSPPHRARLTGTGSTAAATDKPTPPFTMSPSRASAATPEPGHTLLSEPLQGSADETSCAA